MRDDPQRLAVRLAAYVRPRANTKQLALLADCDLRTAENIRRGHWPSARHFAAIVSAFGRDVLDAVFNPEIDAVEARLQEEERHAREVYLAARARREATCRAGPSSADPVLPFEEWAE